ncbi:hypothetical protein CR513_54136, partial [Mucuna pruriens]
MLKPSNILYNFHSGFGRRYRFKANSKFDILLNNMSEGFNNVIVTAKGKRVTMLEEIRKIASFRGSILLEIKKRLGQELTNTNWWLTRYFIYFCFENNYLRPKGLHSCIFQEKIYEAIYAPLIYLVNESISRRKHSTVMFYHHQ